MDLRSCRRMLANHVASSVRDMISPVKLLDGRHGRFYHPGFSEQQAWSWMMRDSETETCILCVLLTIVLGSA